MLSGCLVTGILRFVNKCPIDWYSKKQGTVEIATFGSAANAARTAMEQIIDLRGTLRYYLSISIVTCFQDVWLPGFSASSTSVPLIGTPRNRVRLRLQHLGLRRMPQGLLWSRSSICVVLSATWEFR